MSKDNQDNVLGEAKAKVREPVKEPKQTYVTPKLKEHGSVEEITLQTFFGSFSP